MMRRRACLLVALVTVASLLCGCGNGATAPGSDGGTAVDQTTTSQVGSGAAREWTDITTLAASSDAVVIGTIGEVFATEIDKGGDKSAPGIPMKFFEFRSEETLSGTLQEPSYLAWLDTGEGGSVEGVSQMMPGDRVLIFAELLSSKEMPGIHSVDAALVPLSGDNGVLDVAGDLAIPRFPALNQLAPKSPSAESFKIADIERVVAGVPAN